MDPKRTREALDHFEVASPETRDGQPGVFIAPLNLDESAEVFEAACRWVGLFEECENCEGSGTITSLLSNTANNISTTEATYVTVPCLSCKGRGFSLNQERLERVARLLRPGPWWDDPVGFPAAHPMYVAEAEAAILAYLLEGPE